MKCDCEHLLQPEQSVLKEGILDEDKETIEKLNKSLASVIPEGTATNNKKWSAKNEQN